MQGELRVDLEGRLLRLIIMISFITIIFLCMSPCGQHLLDAAATFHCILVGILDLHGVALDEHPDVRPQLADPRDLLHVVEVRPLDEGAGRLQCSHGCHCEGP